MRVLVIGLLVLAAAAGALYLAGPRVAADTTVNFGPGTIGDDPEAWLAAREADVPGIREGLAKEIVWAQPETKARTQLAIVYVHGFSASKGEISPVADRVAAELGANLYYTRLAGHGRDGPAMAEASVNDWINDYAEAIAIGRAIGERVVVIAMSTGASLATWGATQPALAEDVAGLVMISPNYGVQAAGAWLLTMPWGGLIAELVVGPERGFEPTNEAHAALWTPRYPTRATLPMAALVDLARKTPVETATVPALFIFSDADKVVRPDLTRDVMARWGGAADAMIVEGSDDPSSHVIAGDVMSPSTTGLVSGRILEWISALPR